MTYDPEFNRIYLGTGNGFPWNQRIRSPGGGDNLFLCSVVALNADTGEYVWHYQTTPGEAWDYNSSMDMVLATLEIDGKPRKVLLHAPKNGFFYVLDRENGKLISAEKIGKITWAERVDLKTGRPVEVPGARYEHGGVLLWPSPSGVHNWPPMSFNTQTGLVYVPTTELPGYYSDEGIDVEHWQPSAHMVPSLGVQNVNVDAPLNAGSSALVAWDPVRQRAAWKVVTPGVWNGGTITTAGNLVFQGHVDGSFSAYAADTGERLWNFAAGNGILAPPITFEVAGRQYVSVLTGVTGGGALFGSLVGQFGWQARLHPKRLLTFVLDGKARLPPTPPPTPAVPIDDATFKVDVGLATRGSAVYGDNCLGCHGLGAVSGGSAPDLRASPIPLDGNAFTQVVRNGILVSRGMPRFAELSDDDLQSIQHYLRQRARESIAASSPR